MTRKVSKLRELIQNLRMTMLTLFSEVVYVKENMEVLHTTPEEPSESITGNVLSSLSKECLKKQGKKISNSSANKTMDSLFSCYEEELAKLLAENNEEISFQDKTRKHVASLLENYTCSDEGLPTTQTTHVKKWTYHDTIHDVHLLHERPESQIHLVKNFITQDECDAFQDAASRVLHRGTVANGNGGSRLSDNRKAWQAGIRVPWEKEAGGDHIAQYTRRMYAYANKATGYGMEVAGQEDIMSIQYFGKNGDHPQGSSYTPATPDRYMPHCDGDCAGLQHKPGSRVATMVAYCTVPARGGATNFQNAGIHVKPEKGSAAFFSYMNADTHDMDTGWTTHSGCPVVEGTKRIVVHWMRVGVSADEPWDSFNTLNIPKRFVEDCE